MISARSHQQQLSGNKYLAVFLLCCLLSSCATQVIQRSSVKPNSTLSKKDETEAKSSSSQQRKDTHPNGEEAEESSAKRDRNGKVSYRMALLLPFKSRSVQIATASKVALQSVDLVVDFYQGFMLGLKSYLRNDVQLDVEVLDTNDDIATIKKMINSNALKKDIWIGPIFPDAVKFVADYTRKEQILFFSPLSASSPAIFKNAQLVSVMPNVAIHADKLLKEAVADFGSSQSVNYILFTANQSSESTAFAAELKTAFAKYLPNQKLTVLNSVQQLLALKGDIASYCILVASATRAETLPLLNVLAKFRDTNPNAVLRVYGHPNWAKQAYATATLNKLNIHYTSASYHPSNALANQFESKYKKEYILQPSEYAYNGYDLGVYTAKMMNEASKKGLSEALKQTKMKGLNTDFDFAYHSQYGYVNIGIRLLEFSSTGVKMK